MCQYKSEHANHLWQLVVRPQSHARVFMIHAKQFGNMGKYFQRGDCGYDFSMLPGHGLPDAQFSSLVLDGSPA